VVLIALCMGAFVFLPFAVSNMPQRSPPQAVASSQCSNNLKQIALALHNYHDVYGRFPPAVVTDKSGKPMHSWRVLILPFMDQQPLYKQYNLNEPWDSPNNRRVAQSIVSAYRCPDDDGPPINTSYAMITGPNTLGGKPNEGVTMAEIRDGTSNTIAVVEVAGSGIGWTEPRDLPIEGLPMEIDGPPGKSISSNHPGGANAAMADGAVRMLPNGMDAETLRRLLIRNDGKPIGPF